MKICAFIGDMYRDYSEAIVKNLQQKAAERGHTLDVFGNCSVPSMNPLHAEGLKSILSIAPYNEYDGIILCADTLNHSGMGKDLIDTLLSAEDIPPVISIREDITGFYNIIPDNRKIMHDIAALVISKCRSGDIGFVTGRSDLADSAERLAGFEDAMHEAGYEVSENMIFHGNYWNNQGPETADFFIKDDGSLPEAIICSNDYMAIALMDALEAKGYFVPADTMISGIDDIKDAALHVPSLTTSCIKEDELVEAAVNTLERVVNGEAVDLYVSVSGTIARRESTNDSDKGMDLDLAYKQLGIRLQGEYDNTRGFVLLSADFEDVLSMGTSIRYTLEKIRSLGFFKSCRLCRYRENGREMVGYYLDDNKLEVCEVPFPSDELLPEGYTDRQSGARIYMPICYQNEVYGYAVFDLESSALNYADEKLEFILMLFAQSINRLELYNKVFEVADVIELYVRDAMTGLYNRRGFDKQISRLFKETKYPVAISSIDLDGLKAINDNLGHAEGDTAIKAVADCIRLSLNPGEFAARMGGDEFAAVILIDNPGRIGMFIRTLREKIKNANSDLGDKLTLSASVGTCEVSSYEELMECMNKADKAMYLEKKLKKSRTK